jgi:mono/diheme cytochrome c family protein
MNVKPEQETVRTTRRIGMLAGCLTLGLLLLTGCHLDMWIQPKVRPQQKDDFFLNQMGSRPVVPHTVLHIDDNAPLRTGNPFYTGFANGKLVTSIPDMALQKFAGDTPQEKRKNMLLRGQDRFDIYCTPCHGALGNGNGMIAQRGFALRRQPGNYQTERLRNMPDGHFFDVITHGYGVMYSYADRVQLPEDRWAIVAYIRALQLSQRATLTDVPPAQRAQLETAPNPTTGSEPVQR